MALTYPQNGDLTKSLKSGRKKVPQSARLSAGGGGVNAIWAMPKWRGGQAERGFPKALSDDVHVFVLQLRSIPDKQVGCYDPSSEF